MSDSEEPELSEAEILATLYTRVMRLCATCRPVLHGPRLPAMVRRHLGHLLCQQDRS